MSYKSCELQAVSYERKEDLTLNLGAKRYRAEGLFEHGQHEAFFEVIIFG